MTDNPDAPEPSALDFEAWLNRQSYASDFHHIARAAWKAASAAQAKRLAGLQQECDDLKHDLERYVEIASVEATRAESAEQRLADTQAWLEEVDAIIYWAIYEEDLMLPGPKSAAACARHAARAKAKEPTDG